MIRTQLTNYSYDHYYIFATKYVKDQPANNTYKVGPY